MDILKRIEYLLRYLGEPYDIVNFDGEDCIHRIFANYEFEVSGTSLRYSTLYVWTLVPKEVIAIYKNIPTENLKDVLGYYASIYQNLPCQIQVERQDIEV